LNITAICISLFRNNHISWLHGVKAPKFSHVTPILKCLHWLKYKLLSLTYEAHTTVQPTLHSLISVQPLELLAPHLLSSTSSSLRITNRSFRYASPHLWNKLPVSFRHPCTKHPADDVTLSNSPPIYPPPHRVHHRITVSFQAQNTFSTNLFHHSLLAPTYTLPSRTTLDRTYFAKRFFIFSYFYYFYLFWVVR